jgi:hypothetical protein
MRRAYKGMYWESSGNFFKDLPMIINDACHGKLLPIFILIFLIIAITSGIRFIIHII